MNAHQAVVYWFALFVATLSLGSEARLADWSPDVKGYVGENLVDSFYAKSGRRELLGKLAPNASGPDRIYQRSDGVIEVHEAKFNKEWRGKASLWHEVNGKRMCELSDAWLDEWVRRVDSSLWANERERTCAQLVKANRDSGKLLRVLDEVNYTDGKFRSYRVMVASRAEVSLEELQGPLKIQKFLSHAESLRVKYAKAKVPMKRMKPDLFNSPTAGCLTEPAVTFENYRSKFGIKPADKVKLCPGILLEDGRILIALEEGLVASALIVSVEAGTAVYQYVRGDIWRPEFLREVEGAAVKGAAVGSLSAVAVALGVAPGGFVIVAVAAGSYVLVDMAINAYRVANERSFLTTDDLAHYGHSLRSSLAIADAHARESDAEHFNHKR